MNYKVLIVDDSALMRKHHKRLLEKSGFSCEVAADGKECLEILKSYTPDVITLDINMPVMDGLTCLKEIMRTKPTPVVMVSSLTEKNATYTFDALDLGAIDYIQKPHGQYTVDMGPVGKLMVEKVMSAAKQKHKIRKGVTPVTLPRIESFTQTSIQYDMIVIGVSTGGPNCLQAILPNLPANYPAPIVVAQHMPGRFTKVFSERLNTMCAMKVIEVTEKTKLEKSCIYIAQGDGDIIVEKQAGQIYAAPCEQDTNYMWHPSVSKLVDSAIKCITPKRLCCVQLTGMGNDGALEMTKAFELGATTIAESEETAVVYGMPKELVKRKGATFVMPNHQISQMLF